jgi:hypothetical protein
MEFNIGSILKNLKRRPFDLDLGISRYYNQNSNYITTEPQEVIDKVVEYNEEYFKEKENNLNNIEDWESWYPKNRNNIEYNQILNSQITKIELEEVIAYLPRNKSPGASGATYCHDHNSYKYNYYIN